MINFFIFIPLGISFISAIVLATIAINNYSRTGPKIKKTIEDSFLYDAIYYFSRLSFFCWVILFFISLPGPVFLYALQKYLNIVLLTIDKCFYATWLSIILFFFNALINTLFYNPASLQVSAQFRFSRLLPLWRQLSALRLQWLNYSVTCLIISTYLSAIYFSYIDQIIPLFFYFLGSLFLYIAILSFHHSKEPIPHSQSATCNYNVIMLGVDTLRTDRLGASGYHRKLTPNIDRICENGVLFEKCITPLARTAPSLTSFFSALWPHNHGIRDNYPNADETHFIRNNLVQILNKKGYFTSVISDWAGADFKKINFGFIECNTPDDQWNIKLLLRQGPAYLRLFLSLFIHNFLGKRFLPELYYLAGVPLTHELGLDCRKTISKAVLKNQPFLINLFASSTHVPFGSRYPYYNLFTPEDYDGDWRFIMGDLSTPEQIIESQENYIDIKDRNQIINLYDNCVKEFDDEVGKILDHIEKCGLLENTYIVIYSDHGTDFFETGCWGQGNTLVGDDPSGRIPLIMSGPGLTKNSKFSHVCRSIDFMPTLLDLLNIKAPEHIDGISLLPYLNDNINPNLYAYQETGVWMGNIPGLHPDQLTYPNIIELLDIPDKTKGTLVIDEKYYPTVIKAKNRSIQNDRWKLIYIPTNNKPVYQLYDLSNDPYENCIELHPEIASELKAKLNAWIID